MSYLNIIKRRGILKHLHLAKLLVLIALLSLSALACKSASPPQQDGVVLQEHFDRGTLDLSRWIVTKDGDFAEMVVDVIDADPGEVVDYRLRLRANTIGTSDNTVKFLGVRNSQMINFTEAKTISLDLDWNNQANGSYLTGGIFLCPVATEANPATQPDWIAFEYVGVPPGQNSRFQVDRMNAGNLKLLFTEGWPDLQRTGRKIANQHLEVTIDGNSLRVRENGDEIFSSGDAGINFTQAYLYLQVSSHSNYPTREVYFDNVMVKELSHK